MHIEWTAAELNTKVLEDFHYLNFGRLDPLNKGFRRLIYLMKLFCCLKRFLKLCYPTVIQYA